MSGREAELAERLAVVRGRIADACALAARAPGEVTLVVVTKFFPASDVRVLAGLGVTDVGENRHQEAEAKAADCASEGLRWHMLGGLQSNKAAAVTRWAHVVESVDRAKLVGRLDGGAAEHAADRGGAPLECLVQVSLDAPGAGSARAGVEPGGLAGLAARVADTEHLRLAGLMAVAPTDVEPARAFEELARVRETLLAEHPDARVLSAGMSGDLEEAIAVGATHVRVGRAVLGERPPNQ